MKLMFDLHYCFVKTAKNAQSGFCLILPCHPCGFLHRNAKCSCVTYEVNFIDSVWSNHLPETALCHFLELVVFCFKNITPCLVIHKDLTRSTGNGSNVFHTHKYGCLLVPLSGSVMCEQLLLQFHSFGSLVAVCTDHSHAPHCTTKHISTFPWIYSQERPQSVTVLCLIGISCETITFALNQS